MPMIDSDTLKPALENWIAAREAWAVAACELDQTSSRSDGVQAVIERAERANRVWHERANELATVVHLAVSLAERDMT